MRSVSTSVRGHPSVLSRSRRLLALAGDERLVEQVRRGNDVAFEVVFERHGAPILSFCRHMVGSREEAEDAVQHTFESAHRQLVRDEREIVLKPWLYTIARNRCLSVLRARRVEAVPLGELAVDGLSEQVERRAELRQLLGDLRKLPAEQRAALLLSEVGDLSHAQAAEVLGCEAQQVKALVYQARSGLIARRDARALPCDEVREQLATLRGGALRRNEVRHHVSECSGCRAYRAEVKRQRELLAAALPVAPSLGLKASVLGALGIGGGASVGGGGGALLGGTGAAVSSLGGGMAAKLGVAAVIAAGIVAGGAAIVGPEGPGPRQAPALDAAAPGAARPARVATRAEVLAVRSTGAVALAEGRLEPAPAGTPRPPDATRHGTAERRHGGPMAVNEPALRHPERPAGGQPEGPAAGHPEGPTAGQPEAPALGNPGPATPGSPTDDPTAPSDSDAPATPPAQEQNQTHAGNGHGRGPIETPPGQVPVRRGPLPDRGQGRGPDGHGPPAAPPGQAKADPPATPPGQAKKAAGKP